MRIVRDYELEEKKKTSITKRLLSQGALSVEYRVERSVVDEVEERISFSQEKGPLSIIESYVTSEMVELNNLNIDKLLSVGKDLIRRAQDA